MANFKKTNILDSIFGVFYVMTEGDFPCGGTWKFLFTIVLLLLDLLQVLRSLAVSKYMWSAYSISIMRSVDIVALFFYTVLPLCPWSTLAQHCAFSRNVRQVEKVIPEWIFFSVSILVALGAICNAGYVMKLFRAGQVKILWPLKILRALVASIVTVFFTTVGCALQSGVARCICIH
jgi:hypothetical protein